MEITFLGTGAGYPSVYRGASCIVVKHENGRCWVFDCGEGTQTQIAKCSSVKPGKIDKIFITHLHGDHIFGLPGLMCTMSLLNQSRTDPVDIYGPIGLRKFLQVALSLSRSQIGYSYRVHELDISLKCEDSIFEDWEVDTGTNDKLNPNEIEGSLIKKDEDGYWNVCTDDNMTVRAGWIDHKVASLGYVIQEGPLPGRLNAQLLKSKGIPPGPLYAKIKAGETITTDSGQTISPSDVMGPDIQGRKVAILGDTSCPTNLIELASDCDILVHECTLENERQSDAVERGHSTPAMAANFANQIKAKKLVMTHFSPRFRPQSHPPSDKSAEESTDVVSKLLEQAQEVYKGPIIAAEDFVSVSVPRIK